MFSTVEQFFNTFSREKKVGTHLAGWNQTFDIDSSPLFTLLHRKEEERCAQNEQKECDFFFRSS